MKGGKAEEMVGRRGGEGRGEKEGEGEDKREQGVKREGKDSLLIKLMGETLPKKE